MRWLLLLLALLVACGGSAVMDEVTISPAQTAGAPSKEPHRGSLAGYSAVNPEPGSVAGWPSQEWDFDELSEALHTAGPIPDDVWKLCYTSSTGFLVCITCVVVDDHEHGASLNCKCPDGTDYGDFGQECSLDDFRAAAGSKG